MMEVRKSGVLRAIPLMLIMLLFSPFVYSEVIYVDDDSTGANDGTSWIDAYNYLQDALADANSSDKPVEIQVAQGIYKPDQGIGTTPEDREATFQLISGVTLTGGYVGVGGTEPNIRDVNNYVTIISGDLWGNDADVNDPCDLMDAPTRAENCYHVLTGSGTDNTAVLDGFVITGGNANGFILPLKLKNLSGAGIYNDFGSPTITNCIFTANSAGEEGGGGMYNSNSSPIVTKCIFRENSAQHSGGGICNNDKSNMVLRDCIFTRNRAFAGAGMCNKSQSSPTLTDCTFILNSTIYGNGTGGGMHNQEDSNPTLIGCMFSENSGYFSSPISCGGGVYNDHSHPMLIGCSFIGNSDGMFNRNGSEPNLTDCVFNDHSQHGMYNDASSPIMEKCTFRGNFGPGMSNWHGANPTLRNCTFVENDAGGMSNYYSSPEVTGCSFIDNTSSFVGGMLNYGWSCRPIITDCIFTGNSTQGFGGGMNNNGESQPTVTNCLFSRNRAGWGGAMKNDNSTTIVTSCTFSKNQAGYYGGGIYDDTKRLTLTNCIIWDNIDNIIWDNIENIGYGESAQIYVSHYGVPEINYCCVQGWTGTFQGIGNIGSSPLFVNGPQGDYYLSQIAAGQDKDSRCLNSGSDSATNLGLDKYTTRTDLINDSDIVDMGYHYPLE